MTSGSEAKLANTVGVYKLLLNCQKNGVCRVLKDRKERGLGRDSRGCEGPEASGNVNGQGAPYIQVIGKDGRYARRPRCQGTGTELWTEQWTRSVGHGKNGDEHSLVPTQYCTSSTLSPGLSVLLPFIGLWGVWGLYSVGCKWEAKEQIDRHPLEHARTDAISQNLGANLGAM